MKKNLYIMGLISIICFIGTGCSENIESSSISNISNENDAMKLSDTSENLENIQDLKGNIDVAGVKSREVNADIDIELEKIQEMKAQRNTESTNEVERSNINIEEISEEELEKIQEMKAQRNTESTNEVERSNINIDEISEEELEKIQEMKAQRSTGKTNNTVQTVGRIIEIYGNEVILQVGTLTEEYSNMSMGNSNSSSNISDEIGEENTSKMSNTGMDRTAMSGNASGMDRTAMSGNASGMDRTAMSGDGATKMSGGMSTMMGGSSTSTNAKDMVDLSEEFIEFLIPVTTPVTQYGMNMSFSQLSKGSYITFNSNEEGKILSINVLG